MTFDKDAIREDPLVRMVVQTVIVEKIEVMSKWESIVIWLAILGVVTALALSFDKVSASIAVVAIVIVIGGQVARRNMWRQAWPRVTSGELAPIQKEGQLLVFDQEVSLTDDLRSRMYAYYVDGRYLLLPEPWQDTYEEIARLAGWDDAEQDD